MHRPVGNLGEVRLLSRANVWNDHNLLQVRETWEMMGGYEDPWNTYLLTRQNDGEIVG